MYSIDMYTSKSRQASLYFKCIKGYKGLYKYFIIMFQTILSKKYSIPSCFSERTRLNPSSEILQLFMAILNTPMETNHFIIVCPQPDQQIILQDVGLHSLLSVSHSMLRYLQYYVINRYLSFTLTKQSTADMNHLDQHWQLSLLQCTTS